MPAILTQVLNLKFNLYTKIKTCFPHKNKTDPREILEVVDVFFRITILLPQLLKKIVLIILIMLPKNGQFFGHIHLTICAISIFVILL